MDPKTGEIKQFDTKEAMEEAVKKFGLIPLDMLPNFRCHHCHGRGYIGRDTITGDFIPCNCTKKKEQ